MTADSISHYREFLIILAAAGLVVPLFLRLGINAVLSFLLVGILLNTDVLGQLTPAIPALSALMIANPEAIATLGELGIVFLLFLIGLEISFERLNTMKRLVFGLGGLQVIVTSAVIAAALSALGFAAEEAIILGGATSLSSTAIVVQILSDEKRLGSQAGRTSFAVLLFQDLAVIPMLLLVSILGGETKGPVVQGIFLALVQAGLAIAAIVTVGRYALRPLLRVVASANSADLFMAAALLIAVGAGAAALFAGLSMALGAFIAGLLLAETEYRRALEAVIEPFKGLLLGSFFLLVGLGIDFNSLAQNPLPLIGVAAALILGKAALFYPLARIMKVTHGAAVEAALLLGPGGEFAFVILGSAAAVGILSAGPNGQALVVVSLTMLALPLLALLGRRMGRRLTAAQLAPQHEELARPPDDHQPRVLVAGFGRVGHLVGTMLAEHQIPYIAIDSDPALVARARKDGFPVYYGDASHLEFLRKCGLDEARAVAVTMDNPARVDDVTRVARAHRGDLKIIARARDERHAIRLYAAGATEAVPETVEASLQLGESLLVEAGIAMGVAIASVHERRDVFRRMLGRPNRREALELARRRRRREWS
jgi:CPA2 family monovalent cation:H+ antiporter-2